MELTYDFRNERITTRSTTDRDKEDASGSSRSGTPAECGP